MAPERSLPASMAYRDQVELDPPRTVSFDALLPETQARLARSSQGPGLTCLVHEHRERRPRAMHWFALSVLAGLGAVAMLALGYSELSFDDIARRDVVNGVAAGLVGLSALGVGLARRAQRRVAGLPFRPGIYLWPRELVDARTRRLVLRSTSQLASLTGSRGQLVLRFHDGAEFRLASPLDEPAFVKAMVEQQRADAERAEARFDLDALVPLDPFAAERARWAAERPLPAPSRLAWALRSLLPRLVGALLVALLVAGAARFWAIERAFLHGNFTELLWFASSDRVFASWADRRWSDAVAPLDNASALEQYVTLSVNGAAMAARAEAALGDCAGERQPLCRNAIEGICLSRHAHPEALARGMTQLTVEAALDTFHHCGGMLLRHGWPIERFYRPQLERAVTQRDPVTLRQFGRHYTTEEMKPEADAALLGLLADEEARTRRTLPDAPFAGVVRRLLRYQITNGVEVAFKASLSPATTRELRGADALDWHVTRSMMLDLQRLSFTPFLNLVPASSQKAPDEPVDPPGGTSYPTLTAELVAAPDGDDLRVSAIVWNLHLTDDRWVSSSEEEGLTVRQLQQRDQERRAFGSHDRRAFGIWSRGRDWDAVPRVKVSNPSWPRTERVRTELLRPITVPGAWARVPASRAEALGLVQALLSADPATRP